MNAYPREDDDYMCACVYVNLIQFSPSQPVMGVNLAFPGF